jgi:hypothetical protein
MEYEPILALFQVLSYYLEARIRIKVTTRIWIRIRIKVMRIRNTANTCIRLQQTKLMRIYVDPELKYYIEGTLTQKYRTYYHKGVSLEREPFSRGIVRLRSPRHMAFSTW